MSDVRFCRWAQHRRLVVGLLLMVAWLAFCVLAVLDAETATALAVGAIPVTLVLVGALRIRLPDLKD